MISAILDFLGVSSSDAAANQAQVISAGIAFIGAMIALIAAFIALSQMQTARSIQREALARQAYSEYLKLCFTEPQFACGRWAESPGSLSETMLYEKYEWFVSVMLNACELILLYVSNKDEWMDAIKAQISYHSDYIKSKNFQDNYIYHYSLGLQKLLK